MKPFQLFVISLLATSLAADSVKDSSKLNFDQRVEIVRGLMAEFATASGKNAKAIPRRIGQFARPLCNNSQKTASY